MGKNTDDHIYNTMGVKPVINAMGAVTLLGASSLSSRALKAAQQANDTYASMHELMDRAGEIIADTLGSEAACMTTGTTGGLVMSTAACMCGNDPEKLSSLPDTTGMRNEALFQRSVYWEFARAVTQTGAKLVRVGDEERCTPEQVEAAIGPSTAAIMWLAADKPGQSDSILPLEEMVRIGRKHSVPVVVDGAGQRYPLSKMRWLAQTADLVCFGAKYIGGPNSAGYVCGKKDLIEAIKLQGFITFDELVHKKKEGGIGRAFKIDRSEVAASVVSLQEWFEMDHDARLRESQRRLKVIEDALIGTPHVELLQTGSHEEGRFSLQITPDAKALGKTGREIALELAEGDPAVWVSRLPSWARGSRPDRISLTAEWGALKEGEEHIVARKLREVLTGKSRPPADVVVHHPATVVD